MESACSSICQKHETHISHIIFEDYTASIQRSCLVSVSTEDTAILLAPEGVGNANCADCAIGGVLSAPTCFAEDSEHVYGPGHHQSKNVFGIPAGHLCLLYTCLCVFTFAFDAFAIFALPLPALPLAPLHLPVESAPTSIGNALAPDMTLEEMYSSTRQEVIDEGPQ